MRGVHPGEQILRERHEFIDTALHQPAVDHRVGMKGTALQIRVEPVETAHIALHGSVDVPARGKVADFRFQIQCGCHDRCHARTLPFILKSCTGS